MCHSERSVATLRISKKKQKDQPLKRFQLRFWDLCQVLETANIDLLGRHRTVKGLNALLLLGISDFTGFYRKRKWWRRGESNPCPKIRTQGHYERSLCFFVSPHPVPRDRHEWRQPAFLFRLGASRPSLRLSCVNYAPPTPAGTEWRTAGPLVRRRQRSDNHWRLSVCHKDLRGS